MLPTKIHLLLLELMPNYLIADPKRNWANNLPFGVCIFGVCNVFFYRVGFANYLSSDLGVFARGLRATVYIVVRHKGKRPQYPHPPKCVNNQWV